MAEYEEEETESGKSEDEKLLEEVREFLKQRVDAEEPERSKMMDDLEFCTLDQWPSEIRKDREGDIENGPRPCLTIDKINQYIVQVVNDMRQGKPGINVRPQDDKADVETAKILKGIIRNIEDQSSADIAYATAGESAAKIGLGFFRVMTDYVSPDSFDQEILVKPLPNTFAVYLGPHIMPDGSDAREGLIVDVMEVSKFKELYPGKKCTTDDFDGLDAQIRGYWRTDEVITVVEYYCLQRTAKKLNFLADGTTMTEEDYAKWPAEAGERPAVQDTRTAHFDQLKWAKVSGVEVLDRRDLPGKYIPIVEVIGRESNIEGKRYLWGLVRPAKDSLRMYNYWASTITEKMGLSPKTPFIVAQGQLENLEERWKNANKKNYAYLEYKSIDSQSGNPLPAPQRQPPTPMEAAYFHFMQVIEHDVQTSLGMFKAATGESESQQSGRAILALQRESDTGTYHFGANQGISIRHAGRIILDLIPHYYDTKRIVRIVGDDGEIQSVHINPDQELPVQEMQDQMTGAIRNVYNPTIGKYDVAIVAGPSYNTKRMEDQAVFVEMAKGATDPGSASVLRYLVMKNSDNPGAQEAAKLLKSMLPPQALQAMESKEPIPPQVMAEMQKMRAGMAQMQEATQKLQQENQQLKSGAQVTMMKVQADEREALAKFRQKQAELAAEKRLQAQAQADERALQEQKLRDAKDLAVFEAQLKAATAIEVAQISAKGSVTETMIEAKTAADIAVTESLNQPASPA